MWYVPFGIILALSVLSLSDARGSYNEAHQLAGRSLQQTPCSKRPMTITRVRMVDFSTLATAKNEVVSENELDGRILVTACNEPVLYGAYNLGQSQVQEISEVISSELAIVDVSKPFEEAVPAAEATLAPIVEFPGRQLKGRSVLDSLNDQQPRRIPTIFAPFYSGFRFELAGRESAPGTSLHFSNMTLLIANATYESLATSGLMDYFDLGTSAHVCMTNSMFVLESCKGFVPNSFHMWCCTKRQCNIQYTEQAIQDLRIPIHDPLEILTCHQRSPPESDSEVRDEDSETAGESLSTVAIIAISIAGLMAVLLLFVVCQGKRRAAAARTAAAAGAGKVIDDSQVHHTPEGPGPTSSEHETYPAPLFQQVTDPVTQGQARPEELKLSMPAALVLDSTINSGSNADTHPSKHVHASTDKASINSSLYNHPYINTVTGTLHRNLAGQRDVGYAAPPPTALRPYNQPLWSEPLSGVYDAQQLASGAGAVGQAAAPEAPTCPLHQVATRDSATNYDAESAALVAPAAGAPAQEWKEHLERQLDSVLGCLLRGILRVLPGHHNRLQGGQAVVQIVEDTSTSLQYAIKFFLSKGAFEQEKGLYSDPAQPLGRFLPQMYAIAEGEGAALRDSKGLLFPPCIIMEKGEALDVWIDNSGDKIDLFTGLQVLSHIVDRLIDLHAAGYVHRDIKPGNIMWLPRTKRWTLIDFGCAAATGSFARTGFSLYYAAPEALRAYIGGELGVQATEALDAWSLGVMAIELLTGKLALDPFRSKAQTIAMILGEMPAPWEDDKTSRAMLRPLGIFKVGVLRLLERDPSKRSTIHQFQQACRRSLANSTATS